MLGVCLASEVVQKQRRRYSSILKLCFRAQVSNKFHVFRNHKLESGLKSMGKFALTVKRNLLSYAQLI